MNYQIRELEFSEVLDQSIELFRDHYKAFMAVLILLQGPVIVATAWIMVNLPTMENLPGSSFTPAEINLFIVFIVLLVLYAFLLPFTESAIAHIVDNAYMGKKTSLGQALKYSFGMAFPLIITCILVYGMILLGTVLCVFPGLVLYLFSLFTVQVVTIERTSYVAAIKRSFSIFKNNAGTIILTGLVIIFLGMMVGSFRYFFPVGWWQELVGASADVMMTGVAAIAKTVLYFSTRCRSEGMDLEMMADSFTRVADGRSPESAASMP